MRAETFRSDPAEDAVCAATTVLAVASSAAASNSNIFLINLSLSLPTFKTKAGWFGGQHTEGIGLLEVRVPVFPASNLFGSIRSCRNHKSVISRFILENRLHRKVS